MVAQRWKYWLFGLWLFWFGLPFLLVTDLFPMHRFGMFAHIIPKEKALFHYRLESKIGPSTWTMIMDGGTHFDAAFLTVWAEMTWNDSLKAEHFVSKFEPRNQEFPDSIRVVRLVNSSQKLSGIKLIYPRP